MVENRDCFGTRMKMAYLIMVLGVVLLGFTPAVERTTLKNGSWLCVSPEAYDQAVAEAKHQRGKEREALKEKLLEDKLCMYADDELLEDIMAPWVQVIERQGDKVKVSFMVEFYKRVEYLHRRFSRVNYTGWTSADNLTELAFLSR
ncbi:MAG: hypothetical protein ETSY2_14255 [Candidatus Entotheonella gemina]|uniref:Uncharacterized protein n=2 Tax=Candidatus Entotheonella TaxID=93171 RepID=W4M9N8_9BACT|nr:MAG: hypothetical protein ETSY2_14255 [Candidatus Entotheonella gemina]